MKMRCLGIVLVLVSFCAAPPLSRAAAGGSDTLFGATSTDPEQFRQVLTDLLDGMERATGAPHNGSDAIRNASPQEIEEMLKYVEDPNAFFAAARRIQERIAAGRGEFPGSAPEGLSPGISSRLGLLRTPVAPDYPTDTGAYNDEVLSNLVSLGLITLASDRCDRDALSDYYDIYNFAMGAAEGADAVCTLAGCDPTGIGCAIACAVVEALKLAFVDASVPMDLCEIQDNNIDSAEIQAGYENSVSLLLDLADHDTAVRDAISTHDGDIKAYLDSLAGKLDQQAGLLEKVLENQVLIIKLLNTPQGRRPDWPIKPPR